MYVQNKLYVFLRLNAVSLFLPKLFDLHLPLWWILLKQTFQKFGAFLIILSQHETSKAASGKNFPCFCQPYHFEIV